MKNVVRPQARPPEIVLNVVTLTGLRAVCEETRDGYPQAKLWVLSGLEQWTADRIINLGI